MFEINPYIKSIVTGLKWTIIFDQLIKLILLLKVNMEVLSSQVRAHWAVPSLDRTQFIWYPFCSKFIGSYIIHVHRFEIQYFVQGRQRFYYICIVKCSEVNIRSSWRMLHAFKCNSKRRYSLTRSRFVMKRAEVWYHR